MLTNTILGSNPIQSKVRLAPPKNVERDEHIYEVAFTKLCCPHSYAKKVEAVSYLIIDLVEFFLKFAAISYVF